MTMVMTIPTAAMIMIVGVAGGQSKGTQSKNEHRTVFHDALQFGEVLKIISPLSWEGVLHHCF